MTADTVSTPAWALTPGDVILHERRRWRVATTIRVATYAGRGKPKPPSRVRLHLISATNKRSTTELTVDRSATLKRVVAGAQP